MAIEKSEPRTALIAGIAVSSVVITIVLRFFLISYFAQVHDEEVRVKTGTRPAQLNRQRLLDRRRLENGAMPITQAMNLVAQDTRPRAVWPEVSTDYSALQGWSLRPTGWHAPVAPTITPGPTDQTGAPTMQGGPSTDGTTAPPSAVPVPVPAAPTTTTTTITTTTTSPAAAPSATGGAAH